MLPFFHKKTKSNPCHAILALALDTRTDMNMDFLNKDKVAFQLKGQCVRLEPDSLVICLRGNNLYLPPVGMQLHTYFTLYQQGKYVPHDFLSTLLAAEKRGEQFLLTLTIPEEIGHNQRRNHVRIPAHKEEISGFRVWYGRQETAPDGKPKIQWIAFRDEDVELLDVSGSGIQIGVKPASPLLPYIAARKLLLIRGEFVLHEKTIPLALVGSVIRFKPATVRDMACIAMRFVRWATPRDGKYQWQNIGSPEEGVPPLGVWVFQTMIHRNRLERGESGD